MSEIFNHEWMQVFAARWNADEFIVDKLAGQHFNACIGFGYLGDAHPKGLIHVSLGQIKSAGAYNGETPDWDLRAEHNDWIYWMQGETGLAKLGFMVAHKRLQFVTGDYRQLLHHPVLARVMLRSFELMSNIALPAAESSFRMAEKT